MQCADAALPSDTDENPILRDPDVRLMLRVKNGDDEAFTELVTAYQNRLIGILTHLLQDHELAEDVAQDVFLRVYRSRHGYTATARFSTWLFRIANNLASNARRDHGRRREISLKLSESGPLGPRPAERLLADKSGLLPTRQVDRAELQTVVQAALASLNERQRMALLLHRFEEMSYRDIGETLEMSGPAVKSLLSRARDSLREALEPYLNQGGPADAKRKAAGHE